MHIKISILKSIIFYILLSSYCFADNGILIESEKVFLRQSLVKSKNITLTIDSARQFVYKNSVHKEPFDKDKWNTELMVKRMIGGCKNQTHVFPCLTCGPRANCMKYILNLIGVKSYIVQVYTDNLDTFASHTFLNVYNNDTGRWEVHDPDYNLIYLNENGNRIKVQDLLFNDLDKIIPYYDDGNKIIRGWNASNITLKNNYFEAVMLWDAFVDNSSLLIINQKRFNPYQAKNEVNFLQWCDNIYRNQWGKKLFCIVIRDLKTAP